MSAAILAAGLLLTLAVFLLRGDRERIRTARSLRVGDDSTSVLARLGPPSGRCAPGSMAQVIPAGTPRPVAEETLARLGQETAGRWVWGREPGRCTAGAGDTEVGLDRNGRVLWAVAEHGGEPALLP